MRRTVLALVALAHPAFAGHYSYRACTETSHVVGRDRCTRFGAWSQPFGFVFGGDLDLVSHHFLSPDDVKGTSNRSLPYELMTAPGFDRSTVGVGPRLRFGFQLGRMYDAVELDLQTVTSAPPVVAYYDGTAHQAHASSMFGSHEVVGYTEPLGYVTLAQEVAFGMNFFHYSSDPTTISHFVLELEARGRIAVWVTPTMTLGVAAGMQLFDRHDVTLAVSLGIRSRAFGGG